MFLADKVTSEYDDKFRMGQRLEEDIRGTGAAQGTNAAEKLAVRRFWGKRSGARQLIPIPLGLHFPFSSIRFAIVRVALLIKHPVQHPEEVRHAEASSARLDTPL
jgi:hypothetical protein